jgi:AraC-like DNA-binding protein
MIGWNANGAPAANSVPAAAMFGMPQATEVREFRQWTDFVNANFPWLEHRKHGEAAFNARVSAWRFSGGSLATINASASEVIRTRKLADRAESGQIKLLWQIAGQMLVEQDGRSTMIEAGQSAVCDTTRPYRCRLYDGAHFAVLMLPHAMCPGWERISQTLCGRTLGQRTTLRAAFGALLALNGAASDDDEAGDDTLAHAVQSLITRSLHHCASEFGLHGDGNPRLRRAERYILEHLSDPSLDPDDLAAALCMSRRSLYMLFKQHALTPSKLIHDIRLERSRIALDDPNKQQRKITDIAFDHGFNDYATFSRLFKTHFGLTPSEFRQRHRKAERLDA